VAGPGLAIGTMATHMLRAAAKSNGGNKRRDNRSRHCGTNAVPAFCSTACPVMPKHEHRNHCDRFGLAIALTEKGDRMREVIEGTT
jgi:hypothetical protein